MAHEVKVTRQGQTTIPKPLREKYGIKEGDGVIYIDLGDHIAVVPVPKQPLKLLEDLKLDVEDSVHEMRKEARKTAQKIVEENLKR
ncbi:MAG: AbrB/MazE/SpoVT family DNA-binding domain-containing protein [Thermoproteota archaeon]|nr:AbrB/MazE/SpoVT family DNA-binding domain-containing protein [Thermoproteota archaeon]